MAKGQRFYPTVPPPSNGRYSHFKLSGDGAFRLSIGGYSGDAGDALGYSHGLPFSARDADHDRSEGRNCAEEFAGGWWFGDCGRANLNGLNEGDGEVRRKESKVDASIMWSGTGESVDEGRGWVKVQMKVRPKRSTLASQGGLRFRDIEESESRIEAS